MCLPIHPNAKKVAEKNAWRLKVSMTSFMGGRSGFGGFHKEYLCGNCGGDQTFLNYARGTDDLYPELLWIEVYCADCGAFSMYDL